MNKIAIAFLFLTIISVVGFTSLKIADSIMKNNVVQFEISQNSIIFLSIIILIYSLVYTRWAHLISLNYQRSEGNLKIPILDEKDPGFEYREKLKK